MKTTGTEQSALYLDGADTLDETTLGGLMDLYGDEIRRYVYGMTRNLQQSEDIAQEVFIQAYLRFRSFRGESSLKTWLFTIARNKTINELRSAYVRHVILFAWVKPGQASSSAEDSFLDKQKWQQLREIILALPLKHREVFLLHVVQGWPLAEIADLLEVPEGTVKSRLHRARKKIDERWKELES